MPTQVQNRSTDPNPISRGMPEKYLDHDPAHANKNVQHREALRLALGSILAPKRPYTPSSRSSSGTASPSPYYHNHNHTEHPHLRHLHSHLHPHLPSRLGRTNSSDSHSDSGTPQLTPSTSTPNSSSLLPSPTEEHPPALSPHESSAAKDAHSTPPPIHSPAPMLVHPPVVAVTEAKPDSGSGSGPPKAKFIQTLQSKSAWDALIHGSFS
ncbi:hypothetical protein BD779DRAFT_1517008 [Infundibulicybe gibba]|nr:hypothetical protein BD779DRAFT_1517008 [Infundibulicybe gibba]